MIQREHVKLAFARMLCTVLYSIDSFTEHFPNFISLVSVEILFLKLQDVCK